MLLRLSVALAFAIAVVQASEQTDGTGSKLIAPAGAGVLDRASNNAVQFETSVAASRRVLQVWLTHADPRTLLLRDRLDPERS